MGQYFETCKYASTYQLGIHAQERVYMQPKEPPEPPRGKPRPGLNSLERVEERWGRSGVQGYCIAVVFAEEEEEEDRYYLYRPARPAICLIWDVERRRKAPAEYFVRDSNMIQRIFLHSH